MKTLFVLGCVIAYAMAVDTSFPKDMMCSISAQGYVSETTFYDQPVWFRVNMTRVNEYSHLVMYQPSVGTYAEMLVRPDNKKTYLYLRSFGCSEFGIALTTTFYYTKTEVDDIVSYSFNISGVVGSLSFNAKTMDLVGEYFRFPISQLGKVMTFNIYYNVTVDKDYTLDSVDDTFVMSGDVCENATSRPKDALTSKCNRYDSENSGVVSESVSSSWLVLPSYLVLALIFALAIFF